MNSIFKKGMDVQAIIAISVGSLISSNIEQINFEIF
jgi:hypothetical protein